MVTSWRIGPRAERPVRNRAILLATLFLCDGGCGTQAPPSVPVPSKTTATSRHVDSPMPDVELLLNWFPEAEHGGYFAALAHGYYTQSGLSVKILPGSASSSVLQRVARGQVAFGVENADRVLLGRAQQADVVALMAPLQKSPRAILVHRKSGFRRIEDLSNVTLAANSGAAWLQFVRKKLPLKNVRFVPYSGNVSQFLVNEKLAQQAYVFSEPFIAREKGAEVETLLVAETGYNPYTSVLVTRQAMVVEHTEIVAKFVAASIHGWQTYLEHPAAVNQLIHQKNPGMSLEILEYGAKAIRPLCLDGLPDAHSLGQMTAERWKTLASQMIEAEALPKGTVDPLAAFTTTFMPTRN